MCSFFTTNNHTLISFKNHQKHFPGENIQFYSAILDQPESVVNKYFDLLSVEEKIRADKYKLKQIRNRWIITRGLLRVLLSQYLDCKPKEIEFLYNEFGKPYLFSTSNLSKLCFSLSYSNNLVTYCFGTNLLLGIDVEKIHHIENISEMGDVCFSQFEREWINRLSLFQRQEIFFKVWTIKEAYIKAIGKGLSFSIEKISLELNSDNKFLIKEIMGNKNSDDWKVDTFNPYQDYICSVVYKGVDKEIINFKIDAKSYI